MLLSQTCPLLYKASENHVIVWKILVVWTVFVEKQSRYFNRNNTSVVTSQQSFASFLQFHIPSYRLARVDFRWDDSTLQGRFATNRANRLESQQFHTPCYCLPRIDFRWDDSTLQETTPYEWSRIVSTSHESTQVCRHVLRTSLRSWREWVCARETFCGKAANPLASLAREGISRAASRLPHFLPFWMPPTFIAFDDEIKFTNHRKGDVIQTNRLLFGNITKLSQSTHNNKLMNASMADGGRYAKKVFKTRAKIQGKKLQRRM